MNRISARCRRAPRPVKRRNPAPAIFPARSKSRSPSDSASSQCVLGVKSNFRMAPASRTITFPVASSAFGTEEWGTFGIQWRIFSRSASSAAMRASRPLIRSPTSFMARTLSCASFPAFFRRPISSETAFRSCFSVSASVRSPRRSSSRAR